MSYRPLSALSPLGIEGSFPLTHSLRKSTPREAMHPLLIARSANLHRNANLMPLTKSSISFGAAFGTGLAVQFVPPSSIGGIP
jgi:hypothetical protein